jgi:hypothetical protein
MKYETPELLNVGALENIVLHTSSGSLDDSGTQPDASLKVFALLDVD